MTPLVQTINPLQHSTAVVVSLDGDFACCENCKSEFVKQRDHFFNILA